MVKNNSKNNSVDKESILITGCSSGIGRATAIYLAKKGMTVFATVRKEEDAETLRRVSLPTLIPLCPVDLTHPDQIFRAVDRMREELDRRGSTGLDGLLHNAGSGGPAPIEMLDIDEFHTQLQTRVVGSVALTQACLPLLRQSRGKILWIMTPALIPTPYVTGIHACDFAVACVARTLDIELKGWHIPSIMIRCGGIQTPSGARTVSDVAALLQHDVLKKAHLYEASLTHWAREMVGFDGHRTSPERVAEVVYKVLLSRRPRRRYSVGYMSGAAAFLESLPGSLGDLILKSRF